MRPIRKEQSIVAQLRTGILEMIAERGLKVGDRLPSEEQMTEAFGASRPAVREALKLLEQDNVIRVEHGKGRFLTASSALRVERPITCFESVTAMVAGFGYHPTTRVLGCAIVKAEDEVAKELRCRRGTPLYRVERVRTEKGRALVYSVDYVRVSAFAEPVPPDAWSGSLVALLETARIAPTMSTAKASAVMLPDDVAGRPELAGFGPALLITETCFNAEGEPVLHARVYHCGDSFSFSFVRR